MYKNIQLFGLGLGLITSINLYSQTNFSKFQEQPVSSVKPSGWLSDLMQKQRRGLTGHISVIGDPFDKEGWGEGKPKKMDDWAQYEQNGYWADGALRLGYFIDAPELKSKVKEWINYQLSHPTASGFIGPKEFNNLWPQVVFFRAVMAEYEVTRDKNILKALYHNYHSKEYEVLVGPTGFDFPERTMLHIEIMCWLYQKTGDVFYLNKSEETYKQFCALDSPFSMQSFVNDTIPRTHSVSYCETVKIPAILYMNTGKQEYLDAAVNAIKKVYKFHGMVDGLVSGNEFHDGQGTNEVHETCTASDMQWALGYLLEATGDPMYGDMIEKICFNAGLGSIARDFKSYQYYSGPNQFIAAEHSSHWNSHEFWYMNSRDRASYKVTQRPSCCAGNLNRILPVYASRMWMKKGENGIAAMLYAPSEFRAYLSSIKQEVSISEQTNYPFEGKMSFKVKLKNQARFSLWLRVPEWTKSAAVSINGNISDTVYSEGTFAEINRIFKDGDVIELYLPIKTKRERAPESGIVFCRGPLVFSYNIPATTVFKDTVSDQGVDFYSTYKLPADRWNYGVSTNFTVNEELGKDFSDPWNPEKSPVKLKLKVNEVKNWTLYKETYTPQLPTVREKGEASTIILVPLAATELRLTIFPVMN